MFGAKFNINLRHEALGVKITMADQRQEDHSKFAVAPPRMTALSDHPLDAEQGWIDRFNFPFQLGAVYDILRHPETQTPLTVGIYGDWGTGKTSAMKWLEGLLHVWNKEGTDAQQVTTIPVWFYPWKYQTREDVWRGIVAEIVLATIDARQVSPERVLFAVKRFGAFLGKSFVRALSSVKLKAKDPTGVLGEGEVTFQAVEKILEDFQDLSHPERAYLNKFESMLGNWLKESLGSRERLILFVDDLDRCLPDVTLEVLEAIKLYLNIPGLIFVVGLDKDVVESIVLDHYERRGVSEEKGREYLAKMFQVDVHLFRMQQAVDEFIADQLAAFDLYSSELRESQKSVFKQVFARYSGDSPREVKRVINAAMIAARGWTTFYMGEEEQRLAFNEGLQRHFVRLRLRELGREKMLSSNEGNAFLSQWSDVLGKSSSSRVLGLPIEGADEIHSKDIPTEYQDIWSTFSDFRSLLGDQLLGDLLSVCTYRTSGALIIQETQRPIPIRRSTKRSATSEKFDVFFSYNSEDKKDVYKIGSLLRENGVKVWLDEWELIPGRSWQQQLEQILEEVSSVTVFIGPSGIGPWESAEMEAYLIQAMQRPIPIIPVLLPEGSIPNKLPVFLEQFKGVDMRRGITPLQIDKLIWGITGIKSE